MVVIPKEITDDIQDRLHISMSAHSYTPCGGGCINHSGKLVVDGLSYFIKWNDNVLYSGMFKAEVVGLEILRKTNTLRIPKVTSQGKTWSVQYVILEWIESQRRSTDFWNSFGSGLAALHRITYNQFGLDHDNYIGSLPQENKFNSKWADFFIHQRLEPMLHRAIESGNINITDTKYFERFYKRIPEIIPNELPALLHGDLWSGNFLTDENGKACLIDPAVYYGHREAELAFTKLFGGFDDDFYSSYENSFPLQRGWKNRVDIFNLYPLLVHVNLFGGSYVNSVRAIIKKY